MRGKQFAQFGIITVGAFVGLVGSPTVSHAADVFESKITIIQPPENAGQSSAAVQPGPQDPGDNLRVVAVLPTGEEIARPAEVGETVRLELPSPGGARVSCVGPMSWAPTVKLTPETPATTLQLRRAGIVAGSIVTDGEVDHEGFTVQFTPVGSDPTALLDDAAPSGGDAAATSASGKGRCKIDDSGRFQCLLPTGQHHLRIRTRHRAARFFWGVSVTAGATVDLETVRLYSESTLTGHLAPVAGLRLPTECHIRVVPEGTSPAMPDESEPGVLVTDDGMFQLQDVSAGLSALYVLCPGFAMAEIHRIEVVRGRDVMIYDPIPLSPSFDLVGDVSPPLSPEGTRWRIVLTDHDRRRGLREASEVDATGRWLIEGMQGGRFKVVVETASDPPTMRFHAGEILVVPDPPPAYVEVDLVEVEGRVIFGDEPIAATVTFGLSTVPRQTVPFAIARSDADGRFRVWLSDERWQPGVSWPWPIVVESTDTDLSLEKVVAIRKPRERGERATVDIVIPNTVVRGRVVDGDDRPVSGARVLAEVTSTRVDQLPGVVGDVSSSVGDGSPVESDSDGEFELVGLPEGTARLWAKDDTGRESEPEVVSVAEPAEDGSKQSSVLLRIEDLRDLTMIVDSDAQPVAFATMDVRVRGSAAAKPARTDSAGVARATVSADGDDVVLLSIQPPGRCLTSVARQLPDGDQPLHVNVSSRGCGRIEVILPLGGVDTSLYYLGGEGGGFTSFRLSSWARSNLPADQPRSLVEATVAAEPFVLPRVAAGVYSSCLFRSKEGMYQYLSTGAAQPGECLAPQFVEPFGVVTFDHTDTGG